MANADSIKAKIKALIQRINDNRGTNHSNLNNAIDDVITKCERFEQQYETASEEIIALRGQLDDANNSIAGYIGEIDRLQEQLNSITSTSIDITENGIYSPSEYGGFTYFDSVNVNVDGITLPSLSVPAENQDVRNGKQYIDSSGNLQTGEMLEYGINDIGISITSSSVQITISDSGYYSGGTREVSISSSGANTRMAIDQGLYSVGSSVFSSENLSYDLLIWDFMFRQMTGTSSYYMPANFFLGELGVMLNGAFIATAVNNVGGSTNSITFMGNSCDGIYSLMMPITATISESDGSFTQQITNIILTNNGETVDTSSGIEAGIVAFIPVIG